MKLVSKMVLTVIAAGSLSASAWAQSDVSATVKAEGNPPLRRTTVELRPVESLLSVTPGIAAGGAGVEAYLGHNFAVNVGGSYADVNLPQKFVRTANDKKNTPIVNKGYDFSTGAGLRYYDSPIGDSVYGGLDVSYSEAKNGWKYNDELYQTKRYAVTPSVIAGYRFVWQNGAMLRLGAGVGLPSVRAQKIAKRTSGPESDKGLKKIDDALDQKTLAMLDLGLGVMF